jgi:hypothetical protein
MGFGARRGKIAVYTAIFGGYDLYIAPTPPGDFDVYLITDGKIDAERVHGATVLRVEDDWKAENVNWGALDNTRRARFWKINSHLPCNPVSEYEYALWVDGSFVMYKVDVRSLVERYLSFADLATCRHPMTGCIYEGAELALQCGKDDPAVIKAHVTRYRNAGYPANHGLAETGVLLRRHTPKIAAFNAYWWKELASGSKRDQVSFNYCADTSGVRVAYLEDRRSLGFINKEHLQ